MSELRDRIERVIVNELDRDDEFTVADIAQAIIDQFDLTTNGEHGYVEIWGCYDTRFED